MRAFPLFLDAGYQWTLTLIPVALAAFGIPYFPDVRFMLLQRQEKSSNSYWVGEGCAAARGFIRSPMKPIYSFFILSMQKGHPGFSVRFFVPC